MRVACAVVVVGALLQAAAVHAAAPRFGDATLRIAIDLDEWADPDHVVVALDGTALKIPRDSVAIAVPVAAGAHVVTVSVGRDVVWSKQIILLPDDDELVDIAPEMAEAPPDPPPAPTGPPPKKAADPDDAPWPREFVLRPPTLKARMALGLVSIAGLFRPEEFVAAFTAARIVIGVSNSVELGADAVVCFEGTTGCDRLQAVGGTIRGRVLRRGDETLTIGFGYQSDAVVGSDERILVARVDGAARTHSRRAALAVDIGISTASGDRDATRGLGGYHVGAQVLRQAGPHLAFEAAAGLFVPSRVAGAYLVTLLASAFFSVTPRIDISVAAIRPVALGPNSISLTTLELTCGVVARY